jgi:hypothetical protein
MAGWTINVETAPARVVEDQVEQLLAQLVADGRAIAPAVSLDRQLGVAAAVFQIDVDGYPTAINTSVAIFFDAQNAIGLEPTMRNMTIVAPAP